MINKYDATDIAKKVSNAFRTLCSHRRVDLTADEIDKIASAVTEVLEEKIDNAMIQDRQLNTQTNRVETSEEISSNN